jgi:hypothetical protein
MSEPESPVDNISSSQSQMRMYFSERILVLANLRQLHLSPFDLVLEILDEFYKEGNEKLSRFLNAKRDLRWLEVPLEQHRGGTHRNMLSSTAAHSHFATRPAWSLGRTREFTSGPVEIC